MKVERNGITMEMEQYGTSFWLLISENGQAKIRLQIDGVTRLYIKQFFEGLPDE